MDSSYVQHLVDVKISDQKNIVSHSNGETWEKTWNMEHTKLIKTLNLQVGRFWWTDCNLAAGSWCYSDRAVSCLRKTRISNTFFK